jgi:hypothetical protein
MALATAPYLYERINIVEIPVHRAVYEGSPTTKAIIVGTIKGGRVALLINVFGLDYNKKTPSHRPYLENGRMRALINMDYNTHSYFFEFLPGKFTLMSQTGTLPELLWPTLEKRAQEPHFDNRITAYREKYQDALKYKMRKNTVK